MSMTSQPADDFSSFVSGSAKANKDFETGTVSDHTNRVDRLIEAVRTGKLSIEPGSENEFASAIQKFQVGYKSTPRMTRLLAWIGLIKSPERELKKAVNMLALAWSSRMLNPPAPSLVNTQVTPTTVSGEQRTRIQSLFDQSMENQGLDSALRMAMQANDVPTVLSLIAKASPYQRKKMGAELLNFALKSGETRIVNQLPTLTLSKRERSDLLKAIADAARDGRIEVIKTLNRSEVLPRSLRDAVTH